MQQSDAAYAARVKAPEELHKAEMQMMRSKRAVRFFSDELAKATAAATVATSLVDRKRKAADTADEDFHQ